MNNLLLSFTNFSAEKLIDLMPDSKIPKKFIQNELNNVHIKFSTQGFTYFFTMGAILYL